MPAFSSFAGLTKAMDEEIDTRLGDRMTLVVDGVRTPLPGTHAVEEIVRVTEGGETVVVQRRLSVQERLLPPRLVERGGTVERADPYAPGNPITTYGIRLVQPEHSGRARLILGKPT